MQRRKMIRVWNGLLQLQLEGAKGARLREKVVERDVEGQAGGERSSNDKGLPVLREPVYRLFSRWRIGLKYLVPYCGWISSLSFVAVGTGFYEFGLFENIL
jgi:hypothetical protein